MKTNIVKKILFVERLKQDRHITIHIFLISVVFISDQFLLDLYLIHARYFVFTYEILFIQLLSINFY